MSGGGEKEGVGESSSIGSAGSLAKRNQGELSWESDGTMCELSLLTVLPSVISSCFFKCCGEIPVHMSGKRLLVESSHQECLLQLAILFVLIPSFISKAVDLR